MGRTPVGPADVTPDVAAVDTSLVASHDPADDATGVPDTVPDPHLDDDHTPAGQAHGRPRTADAFGSSRTAALTGRAAVGRLLSGVGRLMAAYTIRVSAPRGALVTPGAVAPGLAELVGRIQRVPWPQWNEPSTRMRREVAELCRLQSARGLTVLSWLADGRSIADISTATDHADGETSTGCGRCDGCVDHLHPADHAQSANRGERPGRGDGTGHVDRADRADRTDRVDCTGHVSSSTVATAGRVTCVADRGGRAGGSGRTEHGCEGHDGGGGESGDLGWLLATSRLTGPRQRRMYGAAERLPGPVRDLVIANWTWALSSAHGGRVTAPFFASRAYPDDGYAAAHATMTLTRLWDRAPDVRQALAAAWAATRTPADWCRAAELRVRYGGEVPIFTYPRGPVPPRSQTRPWISRLLGCE